MNKYHLALNEAIRAINEDIRTIRKSGREETNPAIVFRKEWTVKLAELQDALLKIAQLKQSLKELDLEKSK